MFGFGGGGLGWIIMILWWALILAGIVALVRWIISGASSRRPAPRGALEILKDRYARVEIGREEYERMRQDLES